MNFVNELKLDVGMMMRLKASKLSTQRREVAFVKMGMGICKRPAAERLRALLASTLQAIVALSIIAAASHTQRRSSYSFPSGTGGCLGAMLV
jgi:hypothetical protein